MLDIAAAHSADDLHRIVFEKEEEAHLLHFREFLFFKFQALLMEGDGPCLDHRERLIFCELLKIPVVEGQYEGRVLFRANAKHQAVSIKHSLAHGDG